MSLVVIVIVAVFVLTLVGLATYVALRYEKVGPNEVLIVSGRKTCFVDPESGSEVVKNFAIYHGGGTFVLPVREQTNRMSVELMTLEIQTPEFFTKYGVPIVVDGIAQIKVRSDDPVATATAAEMFLSKSRHEMNEIAHQMMQGHLRAVISTMPFEEIHANPEAFAQTVQRLTAADLANMGIQVVSFTIRVVKDPSGYLTALGRPQMAEIQKNAVLGEAAAHRDAAAGKASADRAATIAMAKAQEESQVAQIAAQLAVAGAEKERDKIQHAYAAEVARARAQSDAAYELEKAKRDQLVTEEKLGVSKVERRLQIDVEELEIARADKQLVHSVFKPAEAEATKITILAQAHAEAERRKGLAQAEVLQARGQAEAEALRALRLAEADGLRAAALAEADGMERKAAAWKSYGSAAVTDMFISKLPEIAAAVAEPLGRIDHITMVSSGDADSGIGRLARGLTEVLGQVPGFAELASSVGLGPMLGQLRPASEPALQGRPNEQAPELQTLEQPPTP